MKCLLLINTSSGNAQRVIDNNDNIKAELAKMYGQVDEKRISESQMDFDIALACQGYDALAVCGGDGTFNSTINATRDLNIDLLYIPCGTFNDAANTIKSIKEIDDIDERRIRRIDIGEINARLFSYVAAAGSFTAIGFLPKSKYKKRFKRLVYYLYAFKEYRLHKIAAKIRVNGKLYDDVFTLIMAIKSKYVFGLNFNKLYKHNNGKGHLLLIKTPTGLFKLVKMFFLFFRAFFIGFRKEHDGKYIKFTEFSAMTIDLDSPQDFCVDGEKMSSNPRNYITFHPRKTKIFIP